jgi:hypothetical protein
VTSGPLPSVTLLPGGGSVSNSVANVCLPAPACNVLQTGVLQVSSSGTLGPTGGSTSSASVVNVAALTGTAAALTAQAVSSTCTVTATSASGSTTIVGGSFGGQALAVNPAPNTTLTLDGVTVILNEQTTTGGPGNFGITVNAIHIHMGPTFPLGQGDIIISQSRCGEQGPNVTIPVAPAGIFGATALVGAWFGIVQYRRRRRDGSAGPPIAST